MGKTTNKFSYWFIVRELADPFSSELHTFREIYFRNISSGRRFKRHPHFYNIRADGFQRISAASKKSSRGRRSKLPAGSA